jgi:hypothetical protein
MKKTIRVIFALALLSLPATAKDNGQWSTYPEATRKWFRELVPPGLPAISCCGEADAYEADLFDSENGHLVAIITDGRGVIPNGTRIAVPEKAKIRREQGNPTGHGIIFIGDTMEIYCYVSPGGA